MNNKITFLELVETIAELTNTSKKVSELFLKELFGVIKEQLEQGESVRVKNLGTFKVSEIAARKSVNVNTGEEIEIASHRRVSFTPDKSLAEAINMPFEGFDSITLDDDISEEDLKELSSIDSEEGVITPPPFIEKNSLEIDKKNEDDIKVIDTESCIIESTQETDDTELIEEINIENSLSVTSEVKVDDNIDIIVSDATEESPIDIKSEEEPVSYDTTENEETEINTEKRKSFVWGVCWGVIITIIVISLAWFIVFGKSGIQTCHEDLIEIHDTIQIGDSASTLQDSTQNNEQIQDLLSSVNSLVMDTVRSNYFLTKMSRKYYGRYEFWVYIYEENKSKIRNPNSVPPGLVVVIPPADKYGIDKNNPESVKKAKELAEKIL